MPFVCEFDTASVHPPANPKLDTQTMLNFPRTFVARPRVPHGFRQLDVGKHANIRVKSTIPCITKTWADCHITAWADTTLHGAVDQIFVLAPADLDFLTGEHMRKSKDPAFVRINFERPFVTPPKVVVFFNHIDLGKDRNWRLDVTATDIDVKGFTLNIDTWGDTILHAVRAGWIAYPEDREHIFSTSVNTMNVRRWSQPQLRQSKEITFDTVEFSKNPSVFIALNSLDIDCSANLRIKAYIDGVSRTGLVWHIDAWSSTILCSAGASMIAFN